jgi:hypothetical protein
MYTVAIIHSHKLLKILTYKHFTRLSDQRVLYGAESAFIFAGLKTIILGHPASHGSWAAQGEPSLY